MTPADLHRLSFDFRAARAVYAGVELGIFEALAAGPVDVKTLSERLPADPRGLRVLLDALTALDLLLRNDDHYSLGDSAAVALVPDSEGYLGNLFLHDLWHWTSWAGLDAVVRDGAPQPDRQHDRHLSDPAVLTRFLPNFNLAMEQSGREFLTPLADLIADLEPESILDLGGGGGVLLLELLERLPRVRAVLVEHGFALEHARKNIDAHPEGKRLELLDLDFEQNEIPSGHDVIVLSRVIMGFTAERAALVLKRAAEQLAPGGALVVADFDSTSRVGALLSLDMLLNTGGGVHDGRLILDWMGQAGLEDESRGHLLPYFGFWIGRKLP
ncbi:MAG: methyltransferase domain-containing protein [bacterium]|nr:methyltransferase domain-containing protein [bacterium]